MKMRSLFLFLLFAGAAQAQTQTVLLLKSSVKVAGPDVLLKDLVSDSSIVPEAWAQRRVFGSPSAGEVNYHSLTTIARALQAYSDMQKVVLRGEPIISVQRKVRRVEHSELEEPIMSYLSGQAPWNEMDLQVEILSVPENTQIPVGNTTFSVSEVDQKTAHGYSLAYMQIRVDDVLIEEIRVGIEIRSLTEVWVVRNQLQPGDTLKEEDLRSEKRVVDATSGYVDSSSDLFGYEVVRSLTPGTLLMNNAVRKPVCVRRGDWVTIDARGTRLHVTLRAKALANGRLGDRILCVNERSQRQILIELVGVGHGVLVRI